MKWKEIFEKSNNKKYAQIIDIDEPLKLESSFKNFFKNNKLYFFIACIIFSILVAITYNGNIGSIFATIVVIAIITLFVIYYNTYKIETKDEKLIATMELKKIQIEYKNLINIYMSKEKKYFLYCIPIYTYSINIIFIDGNEQMIMTLSTFMTNKKDVCKFFKKIKVEVLPKQKEEAIRMRQEELTKKALIISAIIIIAIALIVTLIIAAIKYVNNV